MRTLRCVVFRRLSGRAWAHLERPRGPRPFKMRGLVEMTSSHRRRSVWPGGAARYRPRCRPVVWCRGMAAAARRPSQGGGRAGPVVHRRVADPGWLHRVTPARSTRHRACRIGGADPFGPPRMAWRARVAREWWSTSWTPALCSSNPLVPEGTGLRAAAGI